MNLCAEVARHDGVASWVFESAVALSLGLGRVDLARSCMVLWVLAHPPQAPSLKFNLVLAILLMSVPMASGVVCSTCKDTVLGLMISRMSVWTLSMLAYVIDGVVDREGNASCLIGA